MNYNAVKILTGTSYPELATKIAGFLDLASTGAIVRQFANGETGVSIPESVRGADVFIIQSGSGHVNDACMQMFILASTARAASARRVVAVMPYYPYSKQSKQKKRGGIPAKLIADMLKVAGVGHVITLDLHHMQMVGFFDVPIDNVKASPLLIDYIKLHVPDYKNSVIVAKNAGGSKRAGIIAKRLKLDLAVIHGEEYEFAEILAEERLDAFGRHAVEEEVEKTLGKLDLEEEVFGGKLIGDVRGKVAIIVDDLIDTATPFLAAAKLLKENGSTRVILMATHGLYSGSCASEFQESAFVDEVVTTNSTNVEQFTSRFDKLKSIDCSQVIAEAVRRVHNNESVSSLYASGDWVAPV